MYIYRSIYVNFKPFLLKVLKLKMRDIRLVYAIFPTYLIPSTTSFQWEFNNCLKILLLVANYIYTTRPLLFRIAAPSYRRNLGNQRTFP